MKTATLTDFKRNIKERLQEIEEAQDILILSGPKKREFVVMSLDEYNSMEETAHLLSTQANTQRLLESIAKDRVDEAKIREIKLGE